METIDGIKQHLMDLIIKRSLRIAETEEFTLASGKKSRFYIDCKATLLNAEGLSFTGKVMWEYIKSKNPDAVGGMTLGADPITMSTVLAALEDGEEIVPLIVRKEAKGHGTQKWIEGAFEAGQKIVVVDDVFTTGGSTLKAIDKLQEAGLEIIEAVALIDRQEGAKENFGARNIPYSALFTIKELLAAAEA